VSAALRLKVISCDVFRREIYALASRSPHLIDMEFLPKGLHDIGAEPMQKALQDAIDRTDEGYDAILLAYGLCNNGLVGVAARSVPLVLPRSHDCIGIFLGSRHKYLNYFYANPGVYFQTTGWLERGEIGQDLIQISIQHKNGMDLKYSDLAEKYGEDNAQFIYDTLCDHTHNYSKITYIETGIERDGSWQQLALDKAIEKGWMFEKLDGDLTILRRMLDGAWDHSDFLVVDPGSKISASYNDDIVVLDSSIE
jgi:hypothetical protein